MKAPHAAGPVGESGTPKAGARRTGLSLLRQRLGAALQKHRLRRGLTQGQLAEFAGMSLKYVGEIERGEANTTLDALERLADAVGWDPMEALEGLREPITEGVRLLMLTELRQIEDRTRDMTKWLQALDPGLHPASRPLDLTAAPAAPKNRPRASRRGARRTG